MAEKKSHDPVDEKSEGPIDIHEADVQCVLDKDNELGFVSDDGVIFEGFEREKGRLKADFICDDGKTKGKVSKK